MKSQIFLKTFSLILLSLFCPNIFGQEVKEKVIECKVKDYECLIKKYTAEIKMNPKDAELFYNRGYIYSIWANYENAIADFNRAIELKSNFIDAMIHRGRSYERSYKFDAAIRDYKNVIRLDAKNSIAHLSLGICYADKDENNLAKKQLRF